MEIHYTLSWKLLRADSPESENKQWLACLGVKYWSGSDLMRNLLHSATQFSLCVHVCVFHSDTHNSLGLRERMERRKKINWNSIFPLGNWNSTLLYVCKTFLLFPSICGRTTSWKPKTASPLLLPPLALPPSSSDVSSDVATEAKYHQWRLCLLESSPCLKCQSEFYLHLWKWSTLKSIKIMLTHSIQERCPIVLIIND